MPVVRQSTKAHIAVLLAVLAIVKAADYWLDRYEVTNSQRGIVQGATYSVVKAQLPAILLLILIALLTAGLYLSVDQDRLVPSPADRLRAVARRGDRRWGHLSGASSSRSSSTRTRSRASSRSSSAT